ncbi:MAG TPA: tetratricopeptide repeat protein [Symbiobacteriaceae bacterium]|nr:tetratricopeptide repeat protein [Symbiobacteriaceae bacterium]
MTGLGIFWIFNMLLGTAAGRLILFAAVLWYLDNRYFGLLAALWAPIRRAQLIAGLRRNVEVNPSDIRSMVELGEHYLRGGNYRLAAEYLERAFDRGEDAPRATFLLGAVLVKLGRHAEGRARLAEALAKQPSIAYGEPYVYLLEAAFATEGPQSPQVAELVAQFEHFDGVEVLTRAGQLCAGAGRHDLARDLLEAAIHNYSFTPPKMRRRERRWMVRARLGLLRIK